MAESTASSAPASSQMGQTTKFHDKSDEGYGDGLKKRHIHMIAIGGAIGTGLFLGAGSRLSQGGPALAIVYLACGIFAYIMVRALGELSIHRPSSGGFVSYAREFMGEKWAYVTGWLFFTNWSTTLCADITAVAVYLHYWKMLDFFPQWVWSLIALAFVFTLNMLSVKFFGEFEFWFAMIKVLTIVAFMVVAIVAVIVGGHAGDTQASVSNFWSHGGLFPNGFNPAAALAVGVVFAFGGCELIGIAAGETKDAGSVLPKAINSMIWRIGVLYVGAVILMTMVLPWNQYQSGQSPFVTYFAKLHVAGIGSIVQIVIITAATSSLNAGLYSTGRTLRSMAIAGEAPKWAGHLNKNKVPSHGIIITSCIGLVGVVLNMVIPSEAFNVIIEVAGICIAGTWISILVAHMIFVRRCKNGLDERPKYRLLGAPVINVVTIIFMLGIIAGMGFEGNGRWTLLFFLCVCVLYVIGWYAVRGRINGAKLEQGFLETDPIAVELAEKQ